MKKLRKLKLILLVLLVALTTACTSNPTGNATPPDEKTQDMPIQGGTILHAFCWSFNTIAENMADIADAGYTAIQTSPITECIATSMDGETGMQLGGPNGYWWYHYQPVSYRIGNYQLGTEEEFANMCKVAEEYGVKVIVDAVLNHCAADYGSISDEIKNIPGGAFHEASTNSSSGRFDATQNRLLGLQDINTQNPNIQQEVLKYLKRCVELGASGFRYDAAYHVELPEDEPSFASNFWPVVLANGAEFQYGEVLGSAEAEVYSKYMNVTEMGYGLTLVSAARSGQFNAAVLTDYTVNAPARRLVTWVESHDTFFNAGESSDLTQKQLLYAWAVLAARNDSTALYFSRPDGSMPGVDSRWGNNIVGAKGNDAFKSKEISALNHFKKAMHGTGECFSNPTGDDKLLMIERGSSGAVLINTGAETRLDNVTAQLLVDGSYTDLISGNEFTVVDGNLSGTVNAESVAVFYKEGYSSVSLSPGSRDFYTDTITVTLSAINTANAYYAINGDAPATYTDGQVLTLGVDMDYDETLTITLTTEGNELSGPLARVYTFTKRDITETAGETVVYFNNSDGWDEVYCYVYTSSFSDGVIQNGAWPGELMTHIGGELYSYVLPDWDIFNVMFTNNAGIQFPAAQAPGLRMVKGQSMILEGSQLVPYINAAEE